MNVAALLLLGLIMAPSLAAADEFCDNLNLVAAALPENTSSSPGHFATATLGRGPDVVYALALCRGDFDDSACRRCVADTFRNPLTPVCAEGYKDGFFYGDCLVAYSIQNFLIPSGNFTAYGAPFQRWNITNITGAGDDGAAGRVHELLAETAREASSTARRFATAVMVDDGDGGTTFPPVYALAQCTPDLSAGDCQACLSGIVGMVNSTMAVRMGGQIHVLRCYFRFEASAFYAGEPMLRLVQPPPTSGKRKRHISMLWVIPIASIPLVVAILCFMFYFRRLRRYTKANKWGLQERHSKNLQGLKELVFGLNGKISEFTVFHFDQVLVATSNFSEENKLGRGGFGAVYKGHLPEGLEIAVKRLDSHSGQGFIEFKNEVELIAKLQHTNLVRLLGCCSQGEEKILIYEYLPNKSLDFFIFDESKRALLDWHKCLTIIQGIAHGLLYLHKHSRLRVIHRDLKPSNILLDDEMNPKISDFGLAKIFSSNNTKGITTRRVVGTYGYMAPEYASEGIYSIKSDVFSFGVLIIEILSGKKNSSFGQCGYFINLLGHAWRLYKEGRWHELVNASLVRDCHSIEMMRSIIIALLCVQENADDRPTMSDVITMISNRTMNLNEPKHPANFHARVVDEEASSINDMTISILSAR